MIEWSVRNQLERMWKKAAVAYFMVFCRHLHGGSEKRTAKSQNGRRPDKNSRRAPPSTRLKETCKLRKTRDRSLSTTTKGVIPKTLRNFWHDRVTVVFYTEHFCIPLDMYGFDKCRLWPSDSNEETTAILLQAVHFARNFQTVANVE